MGELAYADYAVIAVFFAVMVGVGVYYSRRAKSDAQFFGGDKSVPWWLSGVSFYMNSFSALAFVMYSALAYQYGWVPVTVSWLSVPAVLLGAWFLAVRWRRAAKGSPIDYIATRYTPKMCRTLAVLGLPMQLLDNALKLLAIGTVVGVGMGFPLFWSICISGLIIVALPPLCLGRLAALDGGMGLVRGFKVFLDRVPDGFFSFTNGKYTWTYMLVFFCAVGSTLSTNWSLVQRYYTTKSERDAKKMAYLVAALLFLGPPLFFFPAMAARVFMPELDTGDSQAMNAVYATLCKSVLPVGMIGMVIAAMFSATMSSLAGNFNAAASVMVNELYLRVDKGATPRRRMFAARAATVLVGGAVVALTFVMQYAQGAKDLFAVTNNMFGVFLPPIAIPMLAGLFIRRLSRRAGMVGLVGGMSVGVALFLASYAHPNLAVLREFEWCFPITAVATIVFLALGTWLFPDKPEERTEVDAFFKQLSSESQLA